MKCSCLSILPLLRVCGVIQMVMIQLPGSESVSPYRWNDRIASQPCPFNKYGITYQNGTQTCSRCTVCPKGFQTQTRCSYYNDTVCESCSSGWYNGVSGSSCQPCSICAAGTHLRRYCTSKRNTVCRPCPSYTYTTKPNATVCIPCSRCEQNQKMVSRCNGSRDTACGDCEKDHFRLSSSGSCLPCSTCPPTLQYLVVPECRDKRGMYHPDICWPRYAHAQVNSIEETDAMLRTHDITPIATTQLEDEGGGIRTYYIFLVATLGSIVCCAVLITVAFICLQVPICNKVASKSRFSQQPSVENKEELVYASIHSNINHGSDIGLDIDTARETTEVTKADTECVSCYDHDDSVHSDEDMLLESVESYINEIAGISDYRTDMYVANTILTQIQKENG